MLLGLITFVITILCKTVVVACDVVVDESRFMGIDKLLNVLGKFFLWKCLDAGTSADVHVAITKGTTYAVVVECDKPFICDAILG